MKIALIVAMDKELNLLRPLIDNCSERTVKTLDMLCGNIGRHQVCLMKCGIGKVNAALAAAALIEDFQPDLMLNSGVAGGTGKADVLDIVAATAVAYHDVWCGPGTEPGQAAGCPAQFRCSERVLCLNALKENPKVKYGLMASGDVFVDTPELVSHILRLYPDAAGCDMESAALAQTCLRMGVEFACLRVISDTPGRVSDNGAQYESFWLEAPRESFELIRSIIAEL